MYEARQFTLSDQREDFKHINLFYQRHLIWQNLIPKKKAFKALGNFARKIKKEKNHFLATNNFKNSLS